MRKGKGGGLLRVCRGVGMNVGVVVDGGGGGGGWGGGWLVWRR